MKNKKIVVSVLGILGIILTTIGVTYAFFSYSKTGTKEHSITSGKVTFLYTESSQGITLTDAMPMTDEQGKAQKGEGKVFDFRVTSSVGADMEMPYTITAKVDASSTLPAEYVKVYLTDQLDNEIEPVRILGTLDTYTNNPAATIGEKVIYEGIVPRNTHNYNKLFRLRIWVADNIDMNEGNTGIGSYNEATFSVKINVYSRGESTTEERSISRSNTNISSLTVNNENTTKVDNTHYESEVLISEGTDSATIPIEVNTANLNATVRIEKVDSIGQVVKESGVKKVALTQNVTVTLGTNYFKIIVRPEDKSEPAIYYLTVNVANKNESFLKDSWATIVANVKAGNVSRYAPTNKGKDNQILRPVELTFTVDGQEVKETHYLRVASTSNLEFCTNNCNGIGQSSCGFVIEFADCVSLSAMTPQKSKNQTAGGYPYSYVYNYLHTVLYNALPIEIRESIIDTRIVTPMDDTYYNPDNYPICLDSRNNKYYELSNEKLYLLSYRDTVLPADLDYYKMNADNADKKINRIKQYKQSDGTLIDKGWWLIDVISGNFYRGVENTGESKLLWAQVDNYCVSPAFRIGPLPVDSNNP